MYSEPTQPFIRFILILLFTIPHAGNFNFFSHFYWKYKVTVLNCNLLHGNQKALNWPKHSVHNFHTIDNTQNRNHITALEGVTGHIPGPLPVPVPFATSLQTCCASPSPPFPSPSEVEASPHLGSAQHEPENSKHPSWSLLFPVCL